MSLMPSQAVAGKAQIRLALRRRLRCLRAGLDPSAAQTSVCSAISSASSASHAWPQNNHPGRNSSTAPSTIMTEPLISLSQRPVRSLSLPLPSAHTATVTMIASSAM